MKNLNKGFLKLDDYSFVINNETTIEEIESSDLKNQVHHRGKNYNGYRTLVFNPLRIDNFYFIINMVFNVNFKVMRISLSNVDEEDIKDVEKMFSWENYPFYKEKQKLLIHNNYLESKLGNKNRIKKGFLRLKTSFVEYEYDWGIVGSYTDNHSQTNSIVISYSSNNTKI